MMLVGRFLAESSKTRALLFPTHWEQFLSRELPEEALYLLPAQRVEEITLFF